LYKHVIFHYFYEVINRFNVRIYGILIHENKVLLADEMIRGNKITKFPGGGLEFGEGTKECLIREFREELDLEIKEIHHFYTTDFFQASAFDNTSQVISIYYKVDAAGPINFKQSEVLSFRWISADDITEADVTLPIDKKVAELLGDDFSE
jgi:8-oxo-dGTP diphosphatase